MRNTKRCLTVLLLILFVLILLVPSVYIALHSVHDCAAHHCDICEHIINAKALLQNFAFIKLIYALSLWAIAVSRCSFIFSKADLPLCNTLVGQKVRLNN